MTIPTPQLQRIPKRRSPMKPATVRALFWVVLSIVLAVFVWGFISKVTS